MNCQPYELIFIALIASMIRWYAWLYKVQPAFLRVLFSGKIFVFYFGVDLLVNLLTNTLGKWFWLWCHRGISPSLSHTWCFQSKCRLFQQTLVRKNVRVSLVLRVKLPKTIRTTRASLGRRPSRSSRLAPNPFPRCRVVLLRFEDS